MLSIGALNWNTFLKIDFVYNLKNRFAKANWLKIDKIRKDNFCLFEK